MAGPRKPRTTRNPKRLVVIELASADAVAKHHKDHLSHGGAFGPPGGRDNAVVSLLLVGPAGVPLELTARTVFCSAVGTGYELVEFGTELKKRIDDWVAHNTAPQAAEDAPTTRIPTRLLKPAAPRTAAARAGRATPRPRPKTKTPPPRDDELEPVAAVPRNVLERVRGLSVPEQIKLASSGELPERVALERVAGKAVWEALLRNPRVTPREVAKIARMATASSAMLDSIVANPAWLQVAEVRRALLSNRRLATDMIPRVLKFLSRTELRLVPEQTAYPTAVRNAARKLLPDG